MAQLKNCLSRFLIFDFGTHDCVSLIRNIKGNNGNYYLFFFSDCKKKMLISKTRPMRNISHFLCTYKNITSRSNTCFARLYDNRTNIYKPPSEYYPKFDLVRFLFEIWSEFIYAHWRWKLTWKVDMSKNHSIEPDSVILMSERIHLICYHRLRRVMWVPRFNFFLCT